MLAAVALVCLPLGSRIKLAPAVSLHLDFIASHPAAPWIHPGDLALVCAIVVFLTLLVVRNRRLQDA